ncbi:MAG: hypothetical protein SPK50_03070 [Mobiluncus porci]|uniref:hypothetical protein n=1 Tax=Mobiluncus porci TaxID=2652278 RepID=UPI0012B4054D|nr:hypothetical protein [Mobiluncus porci]MDD7541210.1 hypothetical protein [Mobiluncus porci]MDY5748099.1 hypothetical protein [Mobiluncus porci]
MSTKTENLDNGVEKNTSYYPDGSIRYEEWFQDGYRHRVDDPGRVSQAPEKED